MAKNRKHDPKPIPVRISIPEDGSFVSHPAYEGSVFHFTLVNLDPSVLIKVSPGDVVQLDLTAQPAFAETHDHQCIGEIRSQDAVILRRLGCQTARVVQVTLDPEPVCELEAG